MNCKFSENGDSRDKEQTFSVKKNCVLLGSFPQCMRGMKIANISVDPSHQLKQHSAWTLYRVFFILLDGSTFALNLNV